MVEDQAAMLWVRADRIEQEAASRNWLLFALLVVMGNDSEEIPWEAGCRGNKSDSKEYGYEHMLDPTTAQV